MFTNVSKFFTEEKPSLMMGLFRIAVAITIGAHVVPTFFVLSDNYYPQTALRTLNNSFFPSFILDLVGQSSVGLIHVAVIVFIMSWLMFLFGLFTQLACWVLLIASYYFYALNSFHIGTLSWDILLVTLFLMALTSYPGDYFSIDALRSGKIFSYQQRRPYFVQRLLQLQIASTFFYTGLGKIYPYGNWLIENPLWYLMNYPSVGVTKNFLLKEWMASQPTFCYCVGVIIVMIELMMPVLLFWHRTRYSAIFFGCLFHVVLLLTFDVPTIFFFLFPMQLMLFVNTDTVLKWIEMKRKLIIEAEQIKVIYDGKCGFCLASINMLRIMDLFNRLCYVNLHDVDLIRYHPDLSQERALKQMHVIEPNLQLFGGFDAFRRLCWQLPMLYPLLVVFYFPGIGLVGRLVYQLIARNRLMLHRSDLCKDNSCHL